MWFSNVVAIIVVADLVFNVGVVLFFVGVFVKTPT